MSRSVRHRDSERSTGRTERPDHHEGAASPYLPISDYGVIGNLRTTALVGMNGSIDWCCLPSLSSPSVFGALLDHRRGGRFQIRSARAKLFGQRYLDGTNVLETAFRCDGGRMRVTDFMPVDERDEGGNGTPRSTELHRIIECDDGRVEVEIEWAPRFDYARAEVRMHFDGGDFVATSGAEVIRLAGVAGDEARVVETEFGPVLTARIELAGGEQRCLVTVYGSEGPPRDAERSVAALRETIRFWRTWVHQCGPEGCAFYGPHHDKVVRSALALKLLSQPHTGAIAAAATTSLPEKIGGVRNWDYRFTWIRDASLVSQALFAAGHRREARDFLQWLERTSRASDQRGYEVQIMYGLEGERDLTEHELAHLEGYRGSRPVRIGNAASEQRQLDIYGELIGAAYELVRMGGRLKPEVWRFLAALADQACEAWRRPDHGIWEVRHPPLHFVYSKVMVWVALDRAIQLARRLRLPGNVERWERERELVRKVVLEKGFDRGAGTFVRSFRSTALDAANLLIPVVEFLHPRDPRVQGTIDRTMEHLMENGAVRRYRTEDGLPPGEGAFNLCTLWLVDALALSGRIGEAREIFEQVARRSNHLGLYSEEIHPYTGEFLGNFPQAFSHAGLINSALYLGRAEGRFAPGPAPMGSPEHRAEAGHG